MKFDIQIIARLPNGSGEPRLGVAVIKDVEVDWCPMEPGVVFKETVPYRVEEIMLIAGNGSLYRQATWPLAAGDDEVIAKRITVAQSTP